MNSVTQANKNKVKMTILSYVASGVTGAVGLLNWMAMRQLVLALLVHSPIDKWSWRAIDNFSFVFFGMVWLSIVFFCQYFYLKGGEKGRFRHRFSAVTGVQLLLLFVCQAVPASLNSQWNAATICSALVLGALGIALLYYGLRRSIHTNINRKEGSI